MYKLTRDVLLGRTKYTYLAHIRLRGCHVVIIVVL